MEQKVGSHTQGGRFRWQLSTAWAQMHLVRWTTPVLFRCLRTRTRVASVSVRLNFHVVMALHRALRSADPPEVLPCRTRVLRAPHHDVPLNAVHLLNGSIFPRELQRSTALRAFKGILRSLGLKFMSFNREVEDLTPRPLRSHPGVPCKDEWSDRCWKRW